MGSVLVVVTHIDTSLMVVFSSGHNDTDMPPSPPTEQSLIVFQRLVIGCLPCFPGSHHAPTTLPPRSHSLLTCHLCHVTWCCVSVTSWSLRGHFMCCLGGHLVPCHLVVTWYSLGGLSLHASVKCVFSVNYELQNDR